MRPRGKIAILLHEHDPFPGNRHHLIWPIADCWRQSGIRVRILKGTAQPPLPVDLLVCHVDLTRLPAEYVDYMGRFPRVINGAVTDISKRRISGDLLARNDSYTGRVIVKTDTNFGGESEAREREAAANGKPAGRRWTWGTLRHINSQGYPIFGSPAEVPPAVWDNPDLIVEKFIPERQDEYYAIRICLFLGDVVLNRRIFSHSPIVKGANVTHNEAADVPEELLQIRQRLQFDYGKFDYVMHGGKVHLLDANRTPSGLADAATNASIAGKLAPAIHQYLPLPGTAGS